VLLAIVVRPAAEHTLFARSIPNVVTFSMTSLLVIRLNSANSILAL